MAYLKQVENAGNNAFTKQITSYGETALNGNGLKFTYCDLTDLTIRPYGNLFSSFNFPITEGQQITYGQEFANSALHNIPTNQIIVVEIPQNTYGELIDGKTFKLSFPINTNTGVSVVDCFATYFLPTLTNPNIKIMDTQYADSRSESGYFGINPSTNDLNSSNIAFLFSNQIAPPKLAINYSLLLTSSYTFTSGSSSSVSYTDLSIPFNFVEGKTYKIIISNMYNNTLGYVTTQNGATILGQGQPIFNATIGSSFINLLTNPSLTLDSSSREIFTYTFVCNISASTIVLHSQGNNATHIINAANIEIDEMVLETGSWSRWTTTNKFIQSLGSTSGKLPARFNSPDNILYDQPVGILYLDKGFAVITDPTLISNFAYNYSAATSSGYDNIPAGNQYTGDTTFTQIYFNDATKANSIYNSIYTEFIQAVTCIALPNEFYISNNPTFLEVYGQNGINNINNDPVYITEVGLYNQFGELIGIGKLSEPIPKDKFNIASFNIQLKL